MRDPNPNLRAGHDPRLTALLSREIDAIVRTEVPSMPTNFLPLEQRRTWTEPAGEHAPIPDPRPQARRDPNVERLRKAAFDREVGYSQRLSGSHDEHARTRTFDVDRPTFAPVRRIDPAGRPDVIIDRANAHRRPDG